MKRPSLTLAAGALGLVFAVPFQAVAQGSPAPLFDCTLEQVQRPTLAEAPRPAAEAHPLFAGFVVDMQTGALRWRGRQDGALRPATIWMAYRDNEQGEWVAHRTPWAGILERVETLRIRPNEAGRARFVLLDGFGRMTAGTCR
jgi:hypothetical protein